MIFGSTRGYEYEVTSTETGSLSSLALRDAWKEFGKGRNRAACFFLYYIYN